MKLRLLLALSLSGVALAATALGAGTDFCQLSSEAALQACRLGAQSDFSLASGKCDNVADPAQRKVCNQQALVDLNDAQRRCDDQHSARQVVCQQLGTEPYDPVIDPANFVAMIDNPYLPLKPGTTLVYEGQTAQGFEHTEFFVTHKTKVILGVTCIEVRDTVKVNGVLTEDTFDWFAQDRDGNVWYFGENAKQLRDGLIVGVEGSWTGGVDSAKPGIVMKAHPAVGDFYRQEFLLDTAEDVAGVVSLSESVTVPAGSFDHGLKTRETSPLEPAVLEHKFYAPGVGLILTIDLTSGEKLPLILVKEDDSEQVNEG
jgi:hypothetical protein